MSDEKKSCNVFVVTVGGKRYLYGDGPDDPFSWGWKDGILSVWKGTEQLTPGGILNLGNIVFQSPADKVLAVGGPQTFFKDAWWSHE